MWSPPLQTGHERHWVLTALRNEPPSFPNRVPDFVNRMLSKDASQRPSAREALKLIPGHVELEKAVDLLVNEQLVPGSIAHRRLLDVFFSRSFTEQGATGLDESANDKHDEQLTEYRVVFPQLSILEELLSVGALVPLDERKERMTALLESKVVASFHLFGAVRFTAPHLTPMDRAWSEHHRDPVCLISQSGSVVHLPFESVTKNFVRFVLSRRVFRFLKRVEALRLFYHVKGNTEVVLSEKIVSFDSVYPRPDMEQAGLDCVLVECLDSVCQTLVNEAHVPDLSHMLIEVGHTRFLSNLLLLARVPENKRSLLIQTIRNRKVPFRDAKEAELVLSRDCACSQKSIQAIKFCLPIGPRSGRNFVCEPNPEASEKPLSGITKNIQHNFPASSSVEILSIVERLSSLVERIQKSSSMRVRIGFWSPSPLDITGEYAKILLKSRKVVVAGTRKGKGGYEYEEGGEFLAAEGGRFDELFDRTTPTPMPTPDHSTAVSQELAGVSMRVFVERIVRRRAVETHPSIGPSYPLVRLCQPSETDAAAFPPEDRANMAIKLRSELKVGVVWEHPRGISFEALLAMCKANGNRVVVSKILSPTSSSDMWRVRGWIANPHEGSLVDKKCSSWDSLLKTIIPFIKGQ